MVHFPTSSLATLIVSEAEVKGAPFTVKSKSTGKDFTFKITKSSFKDRLYIHVFVETQYLEFRHLGVYSNGSIIKKGSLVESPSAQAISWILRNIDKGNESVVEANVELMHTGKCLKCGRELTDAQSIDLGLGPVCRGN